MEIQTHQRKLTIKIGSMAVELLSYNFASGPVLHISYPPSAKIKIRGQKGDAEPEHSGHIIVCGTQPEDGDPYESEDYAKFVASVADQCKCDGPVCGGVLAGGFCDEIQHDDDDEG